MDMWSADFWVLASPFLAGLAAAIVAIVTDMAEHRRVATVLAAVMLAAAGVFAVAGGAGYDAQLVFAGALETGGPASYAVAFIFLLAAVVLAGDSDRLSESEAGGPVTALVALGATAAAVLAVSRDVALMILALETVALIGYALVASAHTRGSDEAAMKYFVQGAVVTGLLLYSAAAMFGLFGQGVRYVDMLVIVDLADPAGPILVVMAAFVAAVAYKMSGFPFHSWAPDAFETAEPGSAAALASFPKAAMVFAAAVLFGDVLASHSRASAAMFAAVAVASIVVGNLGALRQTSFQRMLAYSGIAQAGYVLAGFVALTPTSFAVKLFAVTYALGASGAFMAARAIRDADSGWDGTIVGLRGLGERHPVLAAGLAACMLSLTGIPLTAGFWGKFWVFLTVVQADWTWLAIVAFLGSVVSFGYYGAVLKAVYLDSGESSGEGRTGSAAWAVSLLALAIIAVGTVPVFQGFMWMFDLIGV